MHEEHRIEAPDPPVNASAAPQPATGVVVASRPRNGPRSNRARLAIIGVLVGLLVLCTSVFVVRVVRDLRALAGEQGRPGRVVEASVRAVQVHEWAGAQGYLSAPLQARTTTVALRDAWTARARANGTVTGFAVDRSDLRVTTGGRRIATVTGAVGYGKAAPLAVVVTLAEEGDDWKLTPLP